MKLNPDKHFFRFIWPFFIALLLLILALSAGWLPTAHAASLYTSGRLAPSDYLFGSQPPRSDPFFDNYKPIDLSAKVGIGSDCGQMDIQATLNATFQGMLDFKYFEKAGLDIVRSGPMLLTCYMSPTWCAIIKNAQLNANFLSQMRLNQCSLIDKYVDSRVEDYYQERQSCVHKAINSNGGNIDAAMNQCNSNMWDADLANWAGAKNGEKTTTNRLIDSSAQWAGMNNAESRNTVNLVKALVGDTVISRGSVSVEYGPQRRPMTPTTYLQSIEKATYEKLCVRILKKVDDANQQIPVDQIVSDVELKDLSNNSNQLLIDRQTIRALSYMSPKQRDRACRKLSNATAMTLFSNDANRSLDVLTTLTQNPNLPTQRKQEIQQKRDILKGQIDAAIEFNKERNEPLNHVLAQIHEQGNQLQSQAVGDDLEIDANAEANHRTRTNLMDCSDGIMCEKSQDGNL